MLACIGCYCNIMVFSPFKVKVTYYHPLNQWLIGATNGNQGETVMHLQCSETINHYIMVIRPQNMPQTLNFLLSTTKSMVARDNQWQPWTNSDAPSMF